jgi:GDP-mannose 6-dehydrogenase
MGRSSSISVFGLGHVGLVQAACLAEDGRTVIGVDVDHDRLATIAAGQCPIAEPGLPELIARAVGTGRLRVSASLQEAVDASALSVLCVGTPASPGGEADLGDLITCLETLAMCMARKGTPHDVIVRSTLPAGTMRRHVLPRLAAAGAGEGLCLYSPEFMREGSALRDYRRPARIVVGGPSDGPEVRALAEQLYQPVAAPRHFMPYEMAEMAKYADNCWHALKVCFANEVGSLAAAFGVDGRALMELFAEDRQLNISEAYLRPGMPFGGSCLPKDVAAMGAMARARGLELPLLGAIADSNDRHLDRCVREVLETGATLVGVRGISFKPRTSDLRRSPALALVERLLAAGRIVAIHDDDIAPAMLIEGIAAGHPGLAEALYEGRLQIADAAALARCGTVVLCHGAPDHAAAHPDQQLVRLHA